MDCPRCGVSTFADRQNCPDCGWQLSRPYTTTSSAAARTLTVSSAPSLQTAADAAPDNFFLSPPVQAQRARAHRRGLLRRWRVPSEGSAVATLPEEARWQAPARLEIIEMPLVQTSFDFPAAGLEAERLPVQSAAPVGLRFQAGFLDGTLILLASGVFFGLFALLGGQLAVARRDLLIYLAAAFVLASLYFGLFTLLGGRTPGMQYFGLRVVTFEGKPVPLSRALWRAFGYVVSTGSLLLGFVWACLDERHLTWHDHMSQTFLTDRPAL